VLGWHQAEVQLSLLDNGDHEDLNGGFPAAPELITGWANSGLDAGDTEPEAAIIHSGAQSLEWNTGAVASEYMYDNPDFGSAGDFVNCGVWLRGDSGVGLAAAAYAAARSYLQYSLSDIQVLGTTTATWAHTGYVARAEQGFARALALRGVNGATGDRFSDDAYAFTLNAVSLTATAAIEADALEGEGIRIGGRSSGLQTTFNGVNINEILTATTGHIRWDWTPRHGDGDFRKFEESTTEIFTAFGDAANYIRVYCNGNGSIRLRFNDGGGLHDGDWAAAGVTAGTTYLMEIRYNANWIELLVDGVQRIFINQPVNFATIPATVYWGSDQNQANQSDMVVAPPTP
jgi:hypothetical protein